MVRMTLTIEGEPEEMRAAMAAFLGPAPAEVPVRESRPQTITGNGQGVSQSPWTAEDLANLWDYLSPSAREVLSAVAQRPEGYPFSDLERVFRVDMQTIGGYMSSVGHSMRRLYKSGDWYLKPWPISKDSDARQYRMDEDVAEMIRTLSAETTQGD